jgi:hypothetical protein
MIYAFTSLTYWTINSFDKLPILQEIFDCVVLASTSANRSRRKLVSFRSNPEGRSHLDTLHKSIVLNFNILIITGLFPIVGMALYQPTLKLVKYIIPKKEIWKIELEEWDFNRDKIFFVCLWVLVYIGWERGRGGGKTHTYVRLRMYGWIHTSTRARTNVWVWG